LRTHEIRPGKQRAIREAVDEFAADIDRRLRDDKADVAVTVIDYVRAVQKGVNDKKRRADRNAALTRIMEPFFREKRGVK
jgi:hypothetical protein